MIPEMRIFVEGGGEGQDRRFFRQGFAEFLAELANAAREKRIRWGVIASGSEALRDFQISCRKYPAAFNVLLVDAESAVARSPVEHLRTVRYPKSDTSALTEANCHLMVQLMEAWFLADHDALAGYYGNGFSRNALPANANVEKVSKGDVEDGLKAATQNTSKGRYHKMRHAPELLRRIDPGKVRGAAPNCHRLFETLKTKLQEP